MCEDLCQGVQRGGDGRGGAEGRYGGRPSSAATLVILEDTSGRRACKAIRPYLPGELAL